MTVDRLHVLVYGWYHQANLGDDLFAEAFERLFPELKFQFVNQLRVIDIARSDAIIFGGGSFLDNSISAESGAIEDALMRPIFYLGVGLETSVHPDHFPLLMKAQLVAARSPIGLEKIPGRRILIPDLVYALKSAVHARHGNGLLFVPNVNVLPTNHDLHWKHAAWTYFKSEFSQFLDWATERGVPITTLSMCRNKKLDDTWAAAEVVATMEHRNTSMISCERFHTAHDAIQEFASHSVVVTQRYHGTVLAEMAGTPCISVVHHDKLRTGAITVPYYGITKNSLIEAFHSAVSPARDTSHDCEQFGALCSIVMKTLRGG